jgi:ParB family chromosome partitioning protein
MHKALGRGLESLIPVAAAQGTTTESNESVIHIPIDKIKPNRFQPRTHFNESKLQELSDSIKQHGLAQPLLVTPSVIPGEYELIAGERRWRASQLAGLAEVTAVIRQVSDKDRLQLAIIENIQREDLNPIEEAKAYKRLGDEYSYTQEEIATIVGKDRSVVANSMRLLQLPQEVQGSIEQGFLSAGHGKILAGMSDEEEQKKLAGRIVNEKLTVREVEKIVSEWKINVAVESGKKPVHRQDAELKRFSEELQQSLGAKVTISGKSNKGKIEIYYYSLEELERLAVCLQGNGKKLERCVK